MTGAWTLDSITALLNDTVDAVSVVIESQRDWAESGNRDGQYRADLSADEAALRVLDRAGVGVLSEESGLRRADAPLLVVVDPLDGSTNASRGLPWFACSVCAVDDEGPVAAVVANLATGVRYSAVRGGGARRDGTLIAPSACRSLGNAIVGVNGMPRAHLGWSQFRALGAAALDLCAVADGTLDGYVDCAVDAHGVWDYLGGLLVCREAGASVTEAHNRELVIRDPAERRTPVAGATAELAAALRAAR